MRGPSRFTKGQQNAIKAAKEVGASKVEFELPGGGKMTVFLGDNQDEAAKTAEHNEWDDTYGKGQTEIR
jgi:hypothetical protein